jgi:hypothetical protein
MQRFDENRGRLEEVDEGAEEDLDYDYEQVVENGEAAVGSRRRPKKPKELENCAEKKNSRRKYQLSREHPIYRHARCFIHCGIKKYAPCDVGEARGHQALGGNGARWIFSR